MGVWTAQGLAETRNAIPMTQTLLSLSLFAALAPLAPAQEATTGEPFPASTALAEGVSPEALTRLDRLVQSFVDDGEVVGAELLVLKNGRSILHEAYGLRDKEASVPMETGSVFCVRSMTKPVVGAAILMLVDDDRIELDDRVAQYLPAFDVEGSRDITVEHLLTHTSGLPMSLILGKSLDALGGILAVAELGAGHPLDFEPGGAFQYSDQGTDTLTALIEVVTAAPAADFVRARVLEPLGMGDSTCVMEEGHPLRERALPNYAGSRGNWTRFWGPDEPPLFPFFLGSQGLYSTLPDYARFMDLWRRKGRVGGERLLASRYVRQALTLGPRPMGGGTGFPGLVSEYGFLMQLWVDAEGQVVAFGHGGSDGTQAWVFPEENAMALYFTQSRANPTGVRVEEVLGELFLGVPFDPNLAEPPQEEYLGYYQDGENDLYRAIVRDGEDMALEVMGRAVIPLTYLGEDRWKLRPDPSKVLAFERSAEGEVTAYRIGDHREYRFEPSGDLPSADELAARVAEYHRIDLLESLGALRTTSEMKMEKVGITGQIETLLAWPDRYRVDSVAGEEFEHLIFDGERLWQGSRTAPIAILEGQAADLLRRDNAFALFGDWRRCYPRLQVIQRLRQDEKEAFLIRAGDTSAPASTFYVDAKTGRLFRVDGLTHVEGMGRTSLRQSFGDFRDVSGMKLPFRSECEFPNPMLGLLLMEIEVTDAQVGVELAEDAFQPGE